jgi:hypothetical protein
MGEQMDRDPTDYRIGLVELERSARVPPEEQVTAQAQPPVESPLSVGELNRLRVLGIARDGRW